MFTAEPYRGNALAVVHDAVGTWVAAQGTAVGRAGRVHVTQDPDGPIWVGGGVITCVTGSVEI